MQPNRGTPPSNHQQKETLGERVRRQLPAWSPRAVIVGFLLAVTLVPILWFLGARITGVRLATAQDPLGLVAVLATIMGAIFTGAGIVTALTALIALLTIDERVEAKFTALVPTLEKRADAQIQSYLLLNSATSADWAHAEPLVVEALSRYPGAEKARSTFGLRLANNVAEWFLTKHGESLRALQYQPPPTPWDIDPPLTEAVFWLRTALDHNDIGDGRVAAALALMYGARGRFDGMIDQIRRLKEEHPQQLAWLAEPAHLIMLAYACFTGENYLRELSAAVDRPFPVPIERVQASIDKVQRDSNAPVQPLHYVDWYMVGRYTMWDPTDIPAFPILMRVQVQWSDQGERLVRPLIPLPLGTIRHMPPLFDPGQPPRPVPDVIADLDKYGLFICPAAELT